MKALNLTVIIGLLALGAGTTAGDKLAVGAGPATAESVGVAEQIDQAFEAWVEATLNGVDDVALLKERSLLEVLRYDLNMTEARVRELARQAVLAQDSGSSRRFEDAAVSRADFKEALSCLKAKRAIIGSLERTEAFSNKYRLFGDYLAVIRQELGLRPVKLAESESAERAATRPEGGSEK